MINQAEAHTSDLREYMIDLVSSGVAPKPKKVVDNTSRAKIRWLRPVSGHKGKWKLEHIYEKYPLLKTYLEHHKNLHGENMTLEGRPYLLDILCDPTPEIVVKKSVQCGLTEIALSFAFHWAEIGSHILYTLPNHPTRNRFVANRVDRVIARSAHYRALLKSTAGTDNRSLKHMGHGTIHFVGSNTEEEFSEYTADILIVDEQDLCDPNNLNLAKDRLSLAKSPKIWRISNPRRPGSYHAIERHFKMSSQKEWEVRCHCKTWQVLDWHIHFVEQLDNGSYQLKDPKGRPICIECGEPFDRLGPGRWVAKNPGARVSGFHISKVFVPDVDIILLFEKFVDALLNPTALTIFYGSELGEYYLPSENHISRDNLLACINPVRTKWADPQEGPVVMGVDVGSVLNVKASVYKNGRRIACRIAALSSWGALMDLCKELRPACIVIDAMPEQHKVKEFAEECPFKVWACRYGSPDMVQEFKFDPEDERFPGEILANRTSTMDAAYADIVAGLVRQEWPPQAEHVPGFFDQIMKPVRTWDQDARSGAGRFIWTEVDEDHYRHADVYERLAAQVLERTGVHITRLR